MKYSVDKQEKYCVVALHEEKLDTTLAPKLKSELITLHAKGVKNIILDMSEVKYTDSSGLSALLVGNRIMQEEGGTFILSNLTEHVTKLIKISQLDNVLNILPTKEEAIDHVFMNEIENDLNNGDNLN
jgi:anti-sigma B factor antagonist